jgi:hypothetical protein
MRWMGSTNSRASTSWQAMIEDSTKEFLTASSEEGSFSLPSPRRHATGASLTPVTTMSWMKDTSVTQATMTVPPQTLEPRPETGLSSK